MKRFCLPAVGVKRLGTVKKFAGVVAPRHLNAKTILKKNVHLKEKKNSVSLTVTKRLRIALQCVQQRYSRLTP